MSQGSFGLSKPTLLLERDRKRQGCPKASAPSLEPVAHMRHGQRSAKASSILVRTLQNPYMGVSKKSGALICTQIVELSLSGH